MSIDPEVLFHAVESVFSFFIIGVVGYYLAKNGWFSNESTALITRLVTFVSLPVYLLYNINTFMTKDQLLGMVYGLIVPFASIIMMLGLAFATTRLFHVPHNRRGLFYNSFAFSNTIYIGLPVNLALFGETALPYVLLYYFANTSLFWSFGNYCLATDGETVKAKLISIGTIKKIISPPMFGFGIGLVLLLMNIRLPRLLANTANYLGGMTTPLVIMSLGIMIYDMGLKKIRFSGELGLILIARFVISPVLILLLVHFFPLPDLMRKVFIIQSSLPVVSSMALLAKFYGADYDTATIIVSATTLLALVTVPLYMLVGTYF